MTVLALPYFETGAYLSVRQIEDVDIAIDDLLNEVQAVAVPQALVDGAATVMVAGTKGVLVWEGLLVHRHGTHLYSFERLWVHIGMHNAEGTQTVTVKVFFKKHDPVMERSINPVTDTPIITFTTTSLAEVHKRKMVTLYQWPTAGTHPADGEVCEVAVYAYRGNSDTCYVTTYAVEQVLLPDTAGGYEPMDDAGALLDGESADVATDLAHIVNNIYELAFLGPGDIPGFRCFEKQPTPTSNAVSWTLIKSMQWDCLRSGNLYYNVKFTQDLGRDDQKTRFRLVEHSTTTQILLLEFTEMGLAVTGVREGEVDLTALAFWNDLEPYPQQELQVDVYCQFYYVAGTAADKIGWGKVQVLFLGERGPAIGEGYTDFGSIASGDYVHGTAAPALRTLWLNTVALGGDAGTGYASDGYDCTGDVCPFPVGYALIAHRTPVVRRGSVSPGILPRGLIDIVRIKTEGSESDYQQMAFLHTRDYLAYRGIGASIVFTGSDGKESRRALNDPENEAADNACTIFDLTTIPELAPGILYYVRVDINESEDNYIDFVCERTV